MSNSSLCKDGDVNKEHRRLVSINHFCLRMGIVHSVSNMFSLFIRIVLHLIRFTCYALLLLGATMPVKSDGFTEERLRRIGVNSARAVRGKLPSDVAAILDGFEFVCKYQG